MKKMEKTAGANAEKMMKTYEVMDSFEMFNSDGLLEVRWRGPFEGYR